jgi:glycosyltransferase involved in cell wall biosynthesis
LKKIFIHATNIHQGGGRSLLEAMLKTLHDFKEFEFILSLDERMFISFDLAENVQIKRVKPSLLHRFLSERWLAESVGSNDIVLCFGNLPPLFKLHGHAIVFLQNRYLIENIPLIGFSLKVYLRITIERFWLSRKRKNVDEFIVQTLLPFVAEPGGHVRILPHLNTQKEIVFDFLYAASGEKHKNHLVLIEAWILLANDGLFPSLCLTFDEFRFAGLSQFIDQMRQLNRIKVSNLGELSRNDILNLYNKSKALIYPSTFESFGLPLIEARQAGMPVLASELDYVRDVLDPEQAFDPNSPKSIARAVKRFIGVNEQSLPLLDAYQFAASIFKKDM